MNAIDLFTKRASSNSLTNPAIWSSAAYMGGRKTASGEDVTAESATAFSAYYACVTGIAADVAGVPASVVESMEPRGRRPLPEDPVTTLLHDEFNPECDAFTGRETLTQWALGWGKGMAEIVRDGRGAPRELWPIHPSRVRLMRGDGREGRPKGALGWAIRSSDLVGREVWIPDVDMFHIHGCGDGVEGWSVLRAGAEAIGLGLAAQTTAASILGNGLAPSATFSLTSALGPEELAAFHDRLAEQSGAMKSGGLLVLNGEGKLERWTINPQDAQLLEARRFQVEDVCRFFRRHPRKVGHPSEAAGWAKLDAAEAEDVNDCLMPWWIRWEREAKRKLIGLSRKRVSLKFYVQGRLRGDVQTRADYLDKRVKGGTMTPNEAREYEDEEPSDEPNADKLQVQGAQMLLSAMPDEPTEKPPASPLGGRPPPPPPPADSTAPAGDDPTPPDRAPAAGGAPVPVVYGSFTIDLSPIYLDAAARVVAKECAALDRAMKKHGADAKGFATWASDFYAGQREYVVGAFGPLSVVAGGASGAARLATFSASLWPDVVARTGEAFREKPETLAANLAAQVKAAVAAKE